MFKEVSSLIMGAMNLKETLTPEKRGTLDKVIEMAESVIPAIVTIHQQKGAEAAKDDPMVKMAKGMPQFKDIANNPLDLEYVINTMDSKQGEDQTDILLETLGLERTANTQRKNTPAQNDVPDVVNMNNDPLANASDAEVVDTPQ